MEAPAPQLSPSAATLEKAEDVYRERNLDAAKAALSESRSSSRAARRSMRRHGMDWRASPFCRIEPDAAIKLFEKTLGASPDGPTKAWTLVYLARLAKAAGDPERAVKFYQEALGCSGSFGAGPQGRSNRIQKHFEITRRLHIHETFSHPHDSARSPAAAAFAQAPPANAPAAPKKVKTGPGPKTAAEQQAMQALFRRRCRTT